MQLKNKKESLNVQPTKINEKNGKCAALLSASVVLVDEGNISSTEYKKKVLRKNENGAYFQFCMYAIYLEERKRGREGKKER